MPLLKACSSKIHELGIINYLKFKVMQGRLYNSWLIDTPSPTTTLEDLQLFIENDLFLNDMALKNHPDYRLVAKDSSHNTKEISIEQIRELQQFFHKTPSLSRYRVAIIYQADLMNLNAANSCLKLLEDTPANGFIFLVTARAAAIISTIRSRCAKINVKPANYLDNILLSDDFAALRDGAKPIDNRQALSNDAREFISEGYSDVYFKFITYLADYQNPSTRLALIEEFTDKNKALWSDFASSMLYVVNKIIKKALNCNIELHHLENTIFSKLSTHSPNYLIKKFYNIKKIMSNTIDYDLNLKASTIDLITELFYNDIYSK